MNATELRIGNKILYKGEPKLVSLFILKEMEDCPFGKMDEFFQGIPLTPEVLIDYGFEIIGPFKNSAELETRSFKFFYNGDENNLQLGIPNGSDGVGAWIIFSNTPYLHQLQNIYFAITGRELVIKKDYSLV